MTYRPATCNVCKEPLPEGKGRVRYTCKGACRQARYRRKRGQTSRRVQRVAKAIQKRRAVPFMERSYDKQAHQPVLKINEYRHVYECMACGEPYVMDRGKPLRRFCGDTCEAKAKLQWRMLMKALEKVEGKVDMQVWQRFEAGKLSPPCAHCGKPFAPNTMPDGTRMRGRPRKYCSTACGKAAYEARWKTKYRRARVHRFRECAECGERMDRTDTRGHRCKRFCRRQCATAFGERARCERKRMNVGKADHKYGVSGHGMAARLAPKNLRKAEQRNRVAQLFSGGADRNGWRLNKPAEWMGVQHRKQPMFMSQGVLGVWALMVRLNQEE